MYDFKFWTGVFVDRQEKVAILFCFFLCEMYDLIEFGKKKKKLHTKNDLPYFRN